MPNTNDDGYAYVTECSVTCDLCGEHAVEALHVCFSDPLRPAASPCSNLCRSCHERITANAPEGWVRKMEDGRRGEQDRAATGESREDELADLRVDPRTLDDDALIRRAFAVWRSLMIGEAERMLRDPPEPCGLAAMNAITQALAHLSTLMNGQPTMPYYVGPIMDFTDGHETSRDPYFGERYPLSEIGLWRGWWNGLHDRSSGAIVFTIRKYKPEHAEHLSSDVFPDGERRTLILLEDYLADVTAVGDAFFAEITEPSSASRREVRDRAVAWLRKSPPLTVTRER